MEQAMNKAEVLRRYLVRASAGLLLVVALGQAAGLRGVLAQELPPRPPAPPAPQPVDRGEEDEKPDPPGRITCTLIDASSGAPAPGVTVLIGAYAVPTDANGNYDRDDLPPGRYTLRVAAGQGQLTAGPIELTLKSHATLVQHLHYERPAPRSRNR
jgi:hypothetical protein